MTLNLPNWFIQKYEDTVTQRAQQRVAALADTVSGGGSFIGSSVWFPRMGPADAYDSPRLAQIALANTNMDWIEVSARPKFLAFGIWDPDKPKLTVSAATEYGIAAVNGITRAEDNMIRDVLQAAASGGVTAYQQATPGAATINEAITTIGDYNTVADLDTIAAGIAVLGGQYEFENQDITYASPFKLKVNMSLDPYMAKSDMKNNLPWNDIMFKSYERFFDDTGAVMNPASAGVDTFLYARSALASAYNNESTPIEERLGYQLSDMIGRWFQAGACIKEPKGVVRIKSKFNFTLSRKPIPVLEYEAA